MSQNRSKNDAKTEVGKKKQKMTLRSAVRWIQMGLFSVKICKKLHRKIIKKTMPKKSRTVSQKGRKSEPKRLQNSRQNRSKIRCPKYVEKILKKHENMKRQNLKIPCFPAVKQLFSQNRQVRQNVEKTLKKFRKMMPKWVQRTVKKQHKIEVRKRTSK